MVGNGGCFCRKICYNSVILFEGEPDLKLSRLVFPPDGASRGTLRAHRAYLAVLLTLLGVGIGFLGLWLTACADAALPQAELYRSYLDHPLLLALNLGPPRRRAGRGRGAGARGRACTSSGTYRCFPRSPALPLQPSPFRTYSVLSRIRISWTGNSGHRLKPSCAALYAAPC